MTQMASKNIRGVRPSHHSHHGRSRGVYSRYARLRTFLFTGIIVFSIGVMAIYSSLVQIEPVDVDTVGKRSIRSNNSRSGRRKLPDDIPEDWDSWRYKNDNIENPGRPHGSKKGKIKCDQDVHKMVSYWNDPRSYADRLFESPFLEAPSSSYSSLWLGKPKEKKTRYLSFEPDCGGWNNIRMEFETMVVLAAATGRTLILPPDNPLYLLSKEKGNKHRGLQKFFAPFDDVVETISTYDFFQKEVIKNKNYPLPTDAKNRTKVLDSLQKCDWRAKADNSCIYLYEHMGQIADYVPNWHGEHHCLIMDDENWYKSNNANLIDTTKWEKIQRFCGTRQPVYYDKQIHDAPLLHFRSHVKETRLLVHFYAFIYFTNPKTDNYFKRLVRDRVRYSDEIFCAAGKIVIKMITDSFFRKYNGAGAEAGYFAMHIRRGDFQWPKMKLSAEQWHENTKNWLDKPDDEHTLYIATDETDRSFFKPLMRHYKVRFLDDFTELAGLNDLDPNYAGMIDQIVASRARDFVGTYFSSFSAYIGRMRGYHYLSNKRMFYGHLDYWNETHSWVYPHTSYSAREFPIGWVGIDEDYEQHGQDFY